MYRDGVCRVADRYYTKTIEYEDINYQLAQSEDCLLYTSIRHVDVLEAQTGPIFLAYRANADFKHLMDVKKKDFPIFDFVSEDGIRHRGWMIYESAMIHKIEKTFQPFNDCVDDKVHTSAPFLEKGQRVTLS